MSFSVSKLWKGIASMAAQLVLGFFLLTALAVFGPIFLSSPKETLACPALGWLENGSVSGNLSTPTFSWTWENNSIGGPGLYINLFLWNCPSLGNSCLQGYGNITNNPVSSMAFSNLWPYSDPNNAIVDYGRHLPALDCNKTYYWSVYAGDSCTGSMAKDEHFSFTTPGCVTPTHKECVNSACVAVTGAGADNCPNNCRPETHKECVNYACVSVVGAGADNCPNNCSQPTHKECVNSACVSVTGAGADNCPNNCQPQTHKECVNSACVAVTGAGADNCPNNCQPQKHFECRDESCVLVSGMGQSLCSMDSECQIPRHNECRSEACVRVKGPGVNQCDADAQCHLPTHRECRSNACTTVNGGGVDRCTSDDNCRVPQKVICDWLSITPSSGTAPFYTTTQISGHTDNGGYVSSYKFNFGDGTGDFDQASSSIGHAFNVAGTYTVSGFVLDNTGSISGQTTSCQRVITVGSPVLPPPPIPPVIPRTGPELWGLLGLGVSGAMGWILKIRSK